MERTGTVVSTEKVGKETAVIIRGLPEFREGQHLRRGSQVWTIVKKRWTRKPNASVMLNQVSGDPAVPEQGWSLELMHDPVEGENTPQAVPDLTVETVVRFEKSTLICARGVLAAKASDILTDGSMAWKVLDASEGSPNSPGKIWLSIKAQQGTQFDPAPNARLLKKS